MSDSFRDALERLKITISGGLCYFTNEAKHEQLKEAMTQINGIIESLPGADEGKKSEGDHHVQDREEVAPPDTPPTLLAMLEKAKTHVMSPEEIYEQRRSFARGMCPFNRDYGEWCKEVDRQLPPMFNAVVDVSREEIAKIIDPNSFMDIPFTDDPILLGMVEQSKADAFYKAGKILALFGKGKKNDG